jgi:hypothetical protein
MILTDYYRFSRLATKSKTRMDCVASSQTYDPLEDKRADKETRSTEKRDGTQVGDLVVYFGDVPENFGGDVHRKADKSLTAKGKNLSSIFVPDPSNNIGYGDMRGETDALIFVFKDLLTANGRILDGGELEVFVARGYSKNKIAIFNAVENGELDEEMSQMRAMAKEEPHLK